MFQRLRRSIGYSRWGRMAVLFFCIATSLGATSGARQDQLSFSINSHEISDLFFLNSSSGWIAVANHENGRYFVFRTINGGKTWTRWDAPLGIFRIWFVSQSLGWALKQTPNDNGKTPQVYLLRTQTGGKTWRQISAVPASSQAEPAYSRAALAFIDSLHGWFVGSSAFARVFETSNGGNTIHIVPNSPKMAVINGIYAKRNQGVWVYGDGVVWYSKDLGNTWTNPINLNELNTNAFAFNVSDIYFSESGQGWLVGQDFSGLILKTEDFGRHWRRVLEDDDVDNFWSVSFWDSSHGCAAGYPTFLTCTRNGGKTWVSRDVLPAAKRDQSELFSKLVLLKSGRGWLLRAGGYLYSTADLGETWHEFDPLLDSSSE